MQFVLADTRELTLRELLEIHDVTGKVNCESLSIDGFRFAPRTALIVGVSWDHGCHPVVDVERIRSNIWCWLEKRLHGYTMASVERFAHSMEVDRLLKRCRHPRMPRARRLARILRWLDFDQQS